VYCIKSYRLRLFVLPLKHVTSKLSFFFKFYDSSFVLTALLLAALYIVAFCKVTVHFTTPQFVLNAILRGYEVSRPNIHRTRPNNLRRTTIKIMFSAEGVRVVSPFFPHISARFITAELYLFLMRATVYKLYFYAFSSADV
jgi:predicted membrane protein